MPTFEHVARDLSDPRQGFALGPSTSPEVLCELQRINDKIDGTSEVTVHRTLGDSTRETARSVDLALKQLLSPVIDQVLPDHLPVLGTLVSKAPQRSSLVEFHHDWTFTDERIHRAVMIWIPLIDVDSRNGALQVIQGSHAWTNGIRPSTTRKGPTMDHQVELAALASTIDMRAGSLLIYDPALIHGSGPNEGADPRPAAVVAAVPRRATLLHFHETDAALEGFQVDESFFTTKPFESRPDGFPPVEPWTASVRPEDIAAGIGRTRAAAGQPSEPMVSLRRFPAFRRRR